MLDPENELHIRVLRAVLVRVFLSVAELVDEVGAPEHDVVRVIDALRDDDEPPIETYDHAGEVHVRPTKWSTGRIRRLEPDDQRFFVYAAIDDAHVHRVATAARSLAGSCHAAIVSSPDGGPELAVAVLARAGTEASLLGSEVMGRVHQHAGVPACARQVRILQASSA